MSIKAVIDFKSRIWVVRILHCTFPIGGPPSMPWHVGGLVYQGPIALRRPHRYACDLNLINNRMTSSLAWYSGSMITRSYPIQNPLPRSIDHPNGTVFLLKASPRSTRNNLFRGECDQGETLYNFPRVCTRCTLRNNWTLGLQVWYRRV
jgi:hypothetical protein